MHIPWKKNSKRTCTYLVYTETKQICAWAEANEQDFRNADKPSS